jgi:membrane protease YdiL (CAAX protease family)
MAYFNMLFHLGLSKDDFEIFFTLSLTLLYFFIIHPSLRYEFSKHVIKTKELDRIIGIPILLAIIELIISYLYMYFPVFFGHDAVSLGKDQYVGHKELSVFGWIFLVGIIGPLNEEIFFRFLLLYFIPYTILLSLKNSLAFLKGKDGKWTNWFFKIANHSKSLYNQVFELRDKKLIIFWIIINSSFFSMLHGPNLSSFPVYFFPGVLYSFLFLRYGLISSWVAHGFGNVFSFIINQIFISTLSSFHFIN